VVGFHKVGTGDPLACPTCHGAMRLVAITQTSVIDQLFTHRRSRRGAGEVDDCAVRWTDGQPPPIAIPIPRTD
jgi:hypothetical protein